MDKSNLLYAVEANFDNHSPINGCCTFCKKSWKLHKGKMAHVNFHYINHEVAKRTQFSIRVCQNCFDIKINRKSLNELNNIIPLLKIKEDINLFDKKQSVLPVFIGTILMREYDYDTELGVPDIHSHWVGGKYDYSLIASDITVKEYIKCL